MEFRWDKLDAPTWIGVVNVTPNSFSDGGAFLDPAAAARRVEALARQGAGIVELGAEASSFFRPGVVPVSAEEQWRRLEPVLGGIRKAESGRHNVPWVALDTRSAGVARRALGAGAAIINDISAGEHDGAMLETVAELGGAVVLMHIGGTFPGNPAADDPAIIETVRGYLAGRVAAAVRAGIARERIAVDPGIGFGKTMADNWRLIAEAREFEKLGCAVVLGISRKRFLATLPPMPEELAAEFAEAMERVGKLMAADEGRGEAAAEHERDAATAAATMLALRRGVRVHRVHNVGLCAAAAAAAKSEPRPGGGTTS